MISKQILKNNLIISHCYSLKGLVFVSVETSTKENLEKISNDFKANLKKQFDNFSLLLFKGLDKYEL